MAEPAPGLRITRKLIDDPGVLFVDSGKRYATQRWVTTVDDWRKVEPLGWINFGHVSFSPSFQITLPD